MQPKSPPNPGRRKFLIGATSAVGAVGIAGAAVPFISAFNPSAAAEAAGLLQLLTSVSWLQVR